MENNTNHIDCLEELKQDYQLVTQKLESQQINNERLLRIVMKHKRKGIKKYVYVELLVCLPIVLWGFLYFYSKNYISLPLVIITLVIGMVSLLCDFRINKVMGKNWLEEDLLASRTTLLKMKQLRTKRLSYDIYALIVWFGFFCYDLYLHVPPALALRLIIAFFIGGILGIGIACAVHRKQQRINDEIIEEIDRFKNEEVS